MRTALPWAAVAVAALALTACSTDAEPDAGDETTATGGTLTIGNSAVYPPMSFLPEGEDDPDARQGFDIDLATAIAEKLGMEPVFEQQSYEQYLPSLTTGRLDIVQSAMQDIESRRETVDFVDYMMTGPQLFTTTANTDLTSIEELCGGSVVLDVGDVGYRDALAAASAEACAADAQISVIDASSTADALLQLDQGRADATIRGAEAVRYLVENEEGYAIVGEPLSYLPVGIAVAPDNTELRDRIADALQSLIDDGSYAEIAEKWGLTDLMIDEVMINGEARG